MNTAIQKLEAKQKKEREELEAKLAIESALPEIEGIKRRVFVSSLYGTVASVTYSGNIHHYDRDVREMTFSDLLEIAESIPGIPATKVKDSCLSIRPTAYTDSLPEEKKERWQEEFGVSCFWYRVKNYRNQQSVTEVCWFAQTDAGIVRVSVGFRTSKFGKMETQYRNHPGYVTCELCRFTPSQESMVIFRDDEPLAESQPIIRWASGSNDQPNDFTVYYCDYRDDKPSTVADFARTLIGK